MNSLNMLLLTFCVATLAISAYGAPYQHTQQTQEEDCDDDKQRPVNNDEFLHNANAGYNLQNSVYLGSDQSQKLRDHYEKLKQKADQFVSTSSTHIQDLGINLNGGSYGKFEAGQSQISSSNHHSGMNAGIRTPVATNFYNNDGSLLHTVEGLKVQGQGVQLTATGGMLPLKNYQEGQVFSQNNGGYGGSFEKHSSSSSQQASTLNSGLPATITYTPTGWEKHHHSSSVSVDESIKRKNYTDFLQPELISKQTSTVIHPLNIGYGAQSAGTFTQSSKTHANYDNSNNGASYGLYQVPMTVIPPLGSNDANYLSETKSQSLSKTLVSSHDSTQGAVDVKPIKIQTNPAGINTNWHKHVHSHVSSQSVNNPSAVLQTSFGTTEAENEQHLQSLLRPITQNSQYASKQEQSSSSFHESSHHSNSGLSSGGQTSQITTSQIKGTSGKVPTNTYVGNPNAPQNSGYAITGENKGFYAKSVELANLLSATLAPMEENQNQNSQQTIQQGGSSSHYDVTSIGSKQVQGGSQINQHQQSGITFVENERNPIILSGGKGYNGGYQNSYEKHQSSSSQYEKTQGSKVLGGQGSYSGVQVLNEPYKVTGGYSGGYNGGSSYDWSQSGSGSGYGQYIQQNGQWRPAGYGTQTGSGYNSNGQSSSSFQSFKGSQSSSGRGVGGTGVVCRDCFEGLEQTHNGYGTPTKNSYGLSSQFSSSSSNINGQKSENKQASVTINDNGKIDTYNRHNK